MKKNILLTFDFELFLGSSSGSVDNCLIKPTLELMKVVEKYQLSPVFFVDTLYLHRLKEITTTNIPAAKDYEKIKQLLQRIISYGGYIFHHIHPHWLDAIYLPDINQWDVSNKQRFALSNLNYQEIEEVFSISNAVVSEIYSETKMPEFLGFRAGGLYAQPFKCYMKQMEKYNIRYDFSVLKNAKSTGMSGLYEFDYSVFPDEDIYTFSEDLLIKQEQGKFIEVSMDQLRLRGIYKILNGTYYRININKESWKRLGDGTPSTNQVKTAVKSSKLSSTETFSIELLNNYKARLYERYFKHKQFMHLISHPKLFSQHNIEAFDYFISRMKLRFNIETDYFRILKSYHLMVNNK